MLRKTLLLQQNNSDDCNCAVLTGILVFFDVSGIVCIQILSPNEVVETVTAKQIILRL